MTQGGSNRTRGRMPISSPCAGFHVDIDTVRGGTSVCISGALGVSSFSSECVEVRTDFGSMTLIGGGLSILIYGRGRLEVAGRISEVRMLYAKLR